MKKQYLCIISHEDDLPGGGFKHYTAGEVYDFDRDPGARYFKPYTQPPAEDKKDKGVKANG